MAIGLKAVFGAFDPTWAAKAVATIFILAALVIFWAARQQACRSYARMSETRAEVQHPRRMTALAVVLSVGAVGTGIILWSL